MSANLLRTRVIALLGPADPARLDAVADTLADNGIRCMALGLPSPGALASVERLAARLPADFDVGLDNVPTPADVVSAGDAGARFVMAPYLAAEVVHAARGREIAAYPGGMTPGEVHLAWRAGASAVQLFPAGTLGTGHLRALRESLPQIPLIAAGDVSCAGAEEWIAAGAAAVVLGSSLLGDALCPDGDLATLADRARRVCAAAARLT